LDVPSAEAPIGVFDSGVGGLSVLRAVADLMPQEPLVYVADQAHVPYGSRTLEQVRLFSQGIVGFLLEKHVKVVVVACNSASAAALEYLRNTYPDLPFIGMEPAVKPAAEHTRTGIVGVLATPATFQGELFASVVERFAADVTLLRDTCPGLVECIELGDLDGPRPRGILQRTLTPMLERGIDTVVLACTHFPFVIPLIREIVGSQVRVIDPAPAIARQTKRVLATAGLHRSSQDRRPIEFFTSSEPNQLQSRFRRLLGANWPVAGLVWTEPDHLAQIGGGVACSGSSAPRLG
jgi:glutamate racemase